MTFLIRKAERQDQDQILALLPRLADFQIPEWRQSEQLWQGDADLLTAWFEGSHPELITLVATECLDTESSPVLGVAAIRLREEMFSHEPSAHLEIIALSRNAEGRGIAQALIDASEEMAREHGARSMTLHVFSDNTKARALYERNEFTAEVIRYYKPLAD